MNFYELYNSVKLAHEQAPQLELGNTLKSLEEKYVALISENETYLELDHTNYSPNLKVESKE